MYKSDSNITSTEWVPNFTLPGYLYGYIRTVTYSQHNHKLIPDMSS